MERLKIRLGSVPVKMAAAAGKAVFGAAGAVKEAFKKNKIPVIRRKKEANGISRGTLATGALVFASGVLLSLPCAFDRLYVFAFAYAAYVCSRYRGFICAAGSISVCITLFVAAGFPIAFTALGVSAAVYISCRMARGEADVMRTSLVAFITSFCMSAGFCVAAHAFVSELLYAFASSIAAMSLVPAFAHGFGALENLKGKKNYTVADIVFINVCVSALVSGFGRVSVYGVNFAAVLFCAYLLLSSRFFGAGFCLSSTVINAASLCLFCGFDFTYIGLFCIAALVCTALASLPRVFSALGLCLTVAGGALAVSAEQLVPNVAAAVLGSAIFFPLCGYVKRKAEEIKDNTEAISVPTLNETVKTVIKEEVLAQKNMLAEISRNLTAQYSQSLPANEIIKTVCRMVSSDICPACPSHASCWINNAQRTYEAFGEAVRVCMLSPTISCDKLPKRFTAQCSKSYIMFKTISYIYDSFKVKQSYAVKLNSMKNIAGYQFTNLSQTLEKLYSRLSSGMYIQTRETQAAQSELQNKGLKINRLYIIEDFNRKKRVFVHSAAALDENTLSREIPSVLCGALNREIAYDYDCEPLETTDGFCYVYSEQFPYRLSCGFKGCTKLDNEFSGDMSANTVLSNGMHAVAICDGMGSGLEASKQSERVLNMLEALLNAGFDETKALDMINSVLVMDESNEIFAAVDLFLFDLNKGIGEFVKAGACPSYVRRNGEIKKISYDSLPVGILEETHIHKGMQRLEKGDYVYFMSDGFYESVGSDDEFIRDCLLAHNYRNPQKVADALFSDALKKAGNVARDDVSIMVVKVRRS